MNTTTPLEGIEWSPDGRRVYQKDFAFEQNSLSTAIRQRDIDNFSSGIITGGQVTVSEQEQGLLLHPVLAYDIDGNRIEVPQKEFLPFANIPIETKSILVVRHNFATETSETSPTVRKVDTYEFHYRANYQSIDKNDIPLREITHSSGSNPAYSLGPDLRTFRNNLGKLRQVSNEIQATLQSKGIALEFVNAINQLDELLEGASQARSEQVSNLAQQIGQLQQWIQNYSPPTQQNLIGFWNGQGGVTNKFLGDYKDVNLSTEANNIHNYKIPNVDGAFIYVKANFSIEYSFGQNTSKLYIYGNILELTEVYLPGHPSALGHPGTLIKYNGWVTRINGVWKELEKVY